MRLKFYFIAFFILPTFLLAQVTDGSMRLDEMSKRKTLTDKSLVSTLAPTSIGPSIFSCRVTDLAVNPTDPSKFYVAYASGGLWYTESNGTSFKPIFDQEASMTIGAIAVDWKNNTIWVGTGEANSSRSSYAGTGVYRSKDGGKTWDWRGLPESHHIANITLHPNDTNVVFVAVLGHLYTPNKERGLYKTNDGGDTWKQVLFVNENSGAIDLKLDLRDPNIVYAATWERERRAWHFSGAGEGSGIWKSEDSGDNFTRINTDKSGFPSGKNTGRIGLTAGLKNGKTILFASIDNQNPKPKKDEKKEGITKDFLRTISKSDFAKLDEEKLANFLKDNDFPEKYTTKKVQEMVKSDKISPMTLVEYLEDGNTNLFENDYIGAEVYRSEDGGLNWSKTCEEPLELINFSYGYYFSTIRCMPDNPDQIYLLGYLIIRSDDGGKTWKNINGDNVHADHHSLWCNPNRPGHLINGNDGGVNVSWDNGESWIKCNNPPVGQFYAVNADLADNYQVYGGAQDNGVWTGPNDVTANVEWHQSGHYPFKEIAGGDGMQIMIDSRDNNTVYTGSQFGVYERINKAKGESKGIRPKHDLGERPLRFNWQTPIWLSKHNQDVLYIGSNKVHRSLDKGENWEAISTDLTLGGKKGNVPYGTITALHESPMKFGLLYAGTDDGLLYLSRDAGDNWVKISDNLPQGLWCSRIQASAYERGRVYASLSGYRNDDFGSYLYVSEDFGKNWTKIGTDLPAEPINVVKEDPINPNLIYVGSDHGLYFSLDKGTTFMRIAKDFPATPVHDLVVQTKKNDLIIGTHGRSMYKMNVSQLQKLTAEVLNEKLHVFEISKKKYNENWGKKQPYQVTKDPELPIYFYANESGSLNWKIKTKDGVSVNYGTISSVKGLNMFNYSLNVKDEYVKKYQKSVSESEKSVKKTFELKKADSGKIYLYKGDFVFELEGETQSFLIEK
jgi:photosystem II stability/assembly factor-like uncharacterized protein